MSFTGINKYLTIAVSITAILAFLYGPIKWWDNRFAKAAVVNESITQLNEKVYYLEISLKIKVLQDRISYLQSQIWGLEAAYNNNVNNMPLSVAKTYKEMKEELLQSKEKLSRELHKIN